MVTELRVMADYEADPIWSVTSDGGTGAMISLDSLQITETLRTDLRAWATDYDALAQTGYEWPSEDRERQWQQTGQSLADRLARELGPEFAVTLYEDPDDD